MTELPPFVLFYVAAILAAVLPHRLRQVLMLLVPAVGGLAISNLPAGSLIQVDIMSLSLEPLRVDRLSILFGYLFHIAAFLGVLFSLHLRPPAARGWITVRWQRTGRGFRRRLCQLVLVLGDVSPNIRFSNFCPWHSTRL